MNPIQSNVCSIFVWPANCARMMGWQFDVVRSWIVGATNKGTSATFRNNFHTTTTKTVLFHVYWKVDEAWWLATSGRLCDICSVLWWQCLPKHLTLAHVFATLCDFAVMFGVTKIVAGHFCHPAIVLRPTTLAAVLAYHVVSAPFIAPTSRRTKGPLRLSPCLFCSICVRGSKMVHKVGADTVNMDAIVETQLCQGLKTQNYTHHSVGVDLGLHLTEGSVHDRLEERVGLRSALSP